MPLCELGDGDVVKLSAAAEPAETAIGSEVVGVRLLLEKPIEIVVATLWKRFAKVATPLATVAVSVPCSVPPPAERAAVTIVELSLDTRLLKASVISTAGCGTKADPTIAVVAGWVTIRTFAAAAGTGPKAPVFPLNVPSVALRSGAAGRMVGAVYAMTARPFTSVVC